MQFLVINIIRSFLSCNIIKYPIKETVYNSKTVLVSKKTEKNQFFSDLKVL